LQNQLGLDKSFVLKILKPLYRVPEASNHWFKTYYEHYINKLQIQQSTFDPCLLYSTDPFGLVGLQTDNTLLLASKELTDTEEDKLQKTGFLAKDQEQLTADIPLKFNRGLIQLLLDRSISLTQEKQCNNLSIINQKTATSTGTRGITHTLTPKD
jgi:hypothetical protein